MLTIYVEDFEHEILSPILSDNENIFELFIQKWIAVYPLNVVKYIDIYDDTTFNHKMVKDLLVDIDMLISHANESEIYNLKDSGGTIVPPLSLRLFFLTVSTPQYCSHK